MTPKQTIARAYTLIIIAAASLHAVTSNITEYRTAADFSKGDPNGVVIDSGGKIVLNRHMDILAEDLSDVWTINSIAVIGNDTFIGTSPDGAIYKINNEGKQLIYSGNPDKNEKNTDNGQKDTAGDIPSNGKDPNSTESDVQKQIQFANEHIFAMRADSDGRLLAGISGEKCRLLRFSADLRSWETAFEFERDSFIFDMDTDPKGNIYIATGIKGRIYKLSRELTEKTLLYELNERNITSIKVSGDMVYAGSDRRGVVYELKTDGSNTKVLYQSSQTDITSIEIDEQGNIYAAAAGVQMGQNAAGMPQSVQQGSRQQNSEEGGDGGIAFSAADGGVRLSIAAVNPAQVPGKQDMQAGRQQPVGQGAVYRIAPDGIVSTLLQSQAMFLDAAYTGGEIYLATSNKAKLLRVNPLTRFQSEVYEDAQSAQITSLLATEKGLLIGLSNPAKLLLIADKYASKGNWVSDVIDAGQPAIWGSLQLDAHIPDGCKIKVSARSGNLSDTENGDFSAWSTPVEAASATKIDCPVARFAQLKIFLHGTDDKSPTVRGAALASVVPNIAPIIHSIKTVRAQQQQAPPCTINIETTATDENNDPLVFKYEISEIDSGVWVEIEEETKQNSYQWNTLSVPDGIYTVRVTVSDKLGNNPQTSLEAVRLSEPVIVDNAPPVITGKDVEVENGKAIIRFTATDEYSLISRSRYTVNSNTKWISIIPDDMLFDTKQESFTIEVKDLAAGRHIIAVEVADALDNKKYESVIVEIDG